MKYLSSALIGLLLLSASFSTKAQVGAVKINPLSLIASTVNVSYEHVLNDQMTAQLGAFYTFYSFSILDDKTSYNGFGITPEFRYYVTNQSKYVPEGFYVGPFLRYSNLTLKTELGGTVTGEGGISLIGGGGVFGYQFLFGDVVTLDLFLGIGAGSRSFTGDFSDGSELRGFGSGLIIRQGLTIGYLIGG